MAMLPIVIQIQYYSWENFNYLLDMVMPPYNLSIQEAETKGSQVQSSPELHRQPGLGESKKVSWGCLLAESVKTDGKMCSPSSEACRRNSKCQESQNDSTHNCSRASVRTAPWLWEKVKTTWAPRIYPMLSPAPASLLRNLLRMLPVGFVVVVYFCYVLLC